MGSANGPQEENAAKIKSVADFTLIQRTKSHGIKSSLAAETPQICPSERRSRAASDAFDGMSKVSARFSGKATRSQKIIAGVKNKRADKERRKGE